MPNPRTASHLVGGKVSVLAVQVVAEELRVLSEHLEERAPCADLESSPDQSPRDWSLWKFSSRANSICRFRRGRILWMCLTKISFSLWARLMVPHSAATDEYSSDCTKNFLSASLADLMSIPSLMSAWHRFTTPTYPSASGTTLFSSAASALVPLSMMSSLVSTPLLLRA